MVQTPMSKANQRGRVPVGSIQQMNAIAYVYGHADKRDVELLGR